MLSKHVQRSINLLARYSRSPIRNISISNGSYISSNTILNSSKSSSLTSRSQNGQPPKRWFTNFSERRLERLEASANSDPQNAIKQSEFYRELNKVDPLAVTQRYESEQFASNEACMKEYISALSRADKLDKIMPTISNVLSGAMKQSPKGFGNYSSKALSSSANASSAASSNMTNTSSNATVLASQGTGGAFLGAEAGRGTNTEPVHVIMHEPGIKSQLWKTFRTLAMAFLLITGFSALIEDRGLPKGVKEGMGIHNEIDPNQSETFRFSDVQGADEAKAELVEIVEFLKDPVKFTRLGGKLPKGVLLVGPPGTGKTLLARAIAGEAGVPFFYCSGSEFDEMFVGVGARRVRELFNNAKKKAPCIIFIDEIDAIGGSRNPKDQQYVRMTLNQLLVELDGFNQNEGIIVVGATNFPESLDKALVRPGRFDRHVVVPMPDVRGRQQILQHHSKNIPLGGDVDLAVVARGTPGLSGADLANLINQAALKASIEGKKEVNMTDLEYAKDKILMGAERKSAVIDEENRKIVAFHEGGHALVAMYTPGAMPVHKATIMPRGQALGMVAQLPEKDELSWTKKQLFARLDVAMGGRVAEELIFGQDNVTSGASSDIEGATRVAQAIVMRFGMSEKVGPVLHREEDLPKLSPETRQLIESEVKVILEAAKKRAETLLTQHNAELHLLAKALLEHETLTKEEIETVLQGKALLKKI